MTIALGAAAAVPARRGQRPGVDATPSRSTPTRSGFESLLAVEHVAVPVGLREPLPVQRHRPHAAARGLRAARSARPPGLARRAHRADPAGHRHPRAAGAPPPPARQALRHDRPPRPAAACSSASASGWMREEVEALGIDPDERGSRTDEAIDALPRDLARGGAVLRRPALPLRPGPQPSRSRCSRPSRSSSAATPGGGPPGRRARRRLLPARSVRRRPRRALVAGPSSSRSRPAVTPRRSALTMGGLLGDDAAITAPSTRAPSESSSARGPTTSTSSAAPWTARAPGRRPSTTPARVGRSHRHEDGGGERERHARDLHVWNRSFRTTSGEHDGAHRVERREDGDDADQALRTARR